MEYMGKRVASSRAVGKGAKTIPERGGSRIKSQSTYVRNLRALINKRIIAVNAIAGAEIMMFDSGCHLDLIDGYCFRATGTGYVTYVVNTATNRAPERLPNIEQATAANYQKNEDGSWYWTYEQMFNDALAIIAGGVMADNKLVNSGEILNLEEEVLPYTLPTGLAVSV